MWGQEVYLSITLKFNKISKIILLSSCLLSALWSSGVLGQSMLPSSSGSLHTFFFKIKKKIFYLLLERVEGKEKERETSKCGCLSCAPYWGPGPQPRHVPWPEIEPLTVWFAGWHSVCWATTIQYCMWSSVYLKPSSSTPVPFPKTPIYSSSVSSNSTS